MWGNSTFSENQKVTAENFGEVGSELEIDNGSSS